MSLQISIAQIQMPSFWGKTTDRKPSAHSQNTSRSEDNNARRAEILRVLRIDGKPMDYATLESHTGITLFSLRNLVNTLVDNGQVMRSMQRKAKAKALVEAV